MSMVVAKNASKSSQGHLNYLPWLLGVQGAHASTATVAFTCVFHTLSV
jgi:hypothetical protein